jgi:hypothetical protein
VKMRHCCPHAGFASSIRLSKNACRGQLYRLVMLNLRIDISVRGLGLLHFVSFSRSDIWVGNLETSMITG